MRIRKLHFFYPTILNPLAIIFVAWGILYTLFFGWWRVKSVNREWEITFTSSEFLYNVQSFVQAIIGIAINTFRCKMRLSQLQSEYICDGLIGTRGYPRNTRKAALKKTYELTKRSKNIPKKKNSQYGEN